MVGATIHAKGIPQAGYTGTLTVFNSQASTVTVAATDLVRPDDFNSVHNFNATLSGNTTGVASTLSGTNLILAGGPFHTLSMGVAAGAATISFSGGAIAPTTLQRYTEFGAEGTTVAVALTTGSASFRVLQFLDTVSFTRVDIPVFVTPGTTSKTSSVGNAFTSVFVIYTRDANSSLQPIIGQSTTTAYSWSSNTTASMSGGKLVSFNIATSLTPGEYFAGWQIRTATSFQIARTLSISLSCMGVGPVTNTGSSFYASSFTDFGVTASASTNSYFAGIHTNTITATNQTVAMSNISVTGTAWYAANQPIIFRNY